MPPPSQVSRQCPRHSDGHRRDRGTSSSGLTPRASPTALYCPTACQLVSRGSGWHPTGGGARPGTSPREEMARRDARQSVHQPATRSGLTVDARANPKRGYKLRVSTPAAVVRVNSTLALGLGGRQLESRPKAEASRIVKSLQGGRAQPLAACGVATLCYSPTTLEAENLPTVGAVAATGGAASVSCGRWRVPWVRTW